MRAIDTNVLVRLLLRDDAPQARTADRWVAGGAWVPVLAVAEAAWVLTSVYSRSPAELGAAVQMLLDHEHLTLQDREVIEAALATFGGKPSVSFTDAILLEFARRAGNLPLGTFERNLGRRDGAEKL
jgi:predicted nucleic acid-binding protein